MTVKAILTRGSDIPLRAVKWLWSDAGGRIPLGELVLLAGREGSGKSTFDAWLAAQVTNGTLHGAFFGKPKGVIIVATEDDWSTTLAPRLKVAGADLDRIYRLDVTVDDREATLTLPDDIDALEDAINEVEAGLVVLSPLMSRLSSRLDSYKDSEVRQSLEPLVAIATRTRCTFLGIIHLRKSGGDPLHAIMGSTAFPAVARAVLFVQRDGDDPNIRVLGQPKNNLGRIDPDLGGMPQFIIEEKYAGKDPEDTIVTATRLKWLADTRSGTVASVIDTEDPTERSETEIAAEWLGRYIADAGGEAPWAKIRVDAAKEGINERTLQRARPRAKVAVANTQTFPRRTMWRLPNFAMKPKARKRAKK